MGEIIGNNIYDFMRFNEDGMSYLLIIPRKAIIDALGDVENRRGGFHIRPIIHIRQK